MTQSTTRQEISIAIDSNLLQEVDRLTDDRSAAIEEGLQLWRQKQHRIRHFFETADKLAAANDIDPISEEEIQAEIESYRSQKQSP